MPLFTKSLKLRSFKNKRVGRYLLYALGEIILVVAGILIALQINNYNEERKKDNQITGVLQSITYDLEQDTLAVGAAIRYYEARELVASEIINDKYDKDSFRACLLCPTLISTYAPFKINDKGYLQLKDIVDSVEEKDTLTVEIVQFYNAFGALLSDFGEEVKDFTIENVKEWRDEQPWFSKVTSGRPDPQLYEYMNSQSYKNKVAYYYAIVCKNYLNMLRAYKNNASEVLKRIKERNADMLTQKS